MAQSQPHSLKERLLTEAEAFYEAGDFASASNYYDSLLAVYPDDASYAYYSGFSKFQTRPLRSSALPLLQRSADAGYDRAYLLTAVLLHDLGKLEEADEYYSKASIAALKDQESKLRVRKAQYANALAALRSSKAVSVFPLSGSVNSAYIEHTPFVSFNDSTLYFTTRRPMRGNPVKDFYGEFDENIFVARRQADGWTAVAPLVGNVNGILNDALASVSSDEEELIVFKTSRNFRSNALWRAENQGSKGWRLKGRLPEPLNSDFVQSGLAISSDGTTLIISSDRPGGFGGMDLYRVVKFGNGDYSEPVNLGAIINSEQDEVAPYFLADGKTLFFSSNRSESIGGYDIFRCDWEEGNWKNPENIGYPLNSFGDDLQLSVSPRGGVCYFSRAEVDNAADYNILRANLPGFNMESNIFRGLVEDAETGLPVEKAELTIFSDDLEEIKAIYTCRGGRFFIVLLPGESGILKLTAPGYEPVEEKVQYADHQGIWETKKQLVLQKSK